MTAMRNMIDNEKGVALMVVMVLSAVVLAIMSSLIYMATIGTQVSGGQKRYETAQEAAGGGKEVAFEWIGMQDADDYPDLDDITITDGSSDSCREGKLINGTAYWPDDCDASLDIDIDNSITYDFTFQLGDYDVFAKIVNTVEGNSGPSGTYLMKTGVVSSNTGEVPVKKVSYLYTLAVETRSASNPDSMSEKASCTMLYRY